MSSLMENIENIKLDLDVFGKVIGHGQHSVIIDLKSNIVLKSKIANPVLIISREHNKQIALNSIFSNSDAQVQSIKDKNINPELIDYFYELEGLDCIYFLSTRLDSDATKVFGSGDMFNLIGNEYHSFTVEHWDYDFRFSDLPEMISSFQEFSQYLRNNQGSYISAQLEEFENSVVESLTLLSKNNELEPHEPFKIDLHEEQFCRTLDGQLLCVDPLYTVNF